TANRRTSFISESFPGDGMPLKDLCQVKISPAPASRFPKGRRLLSLLMQTTERNNQMSSMSRRNRKKPPQIDPSCGEWEELTDEQKLLAEIETEYLIDVGEWREFYPWLTWNRAQEAARYLDTVRPGWRNVPGCHHELVCETIAQLHPELALKAQRRRAPRG